MFAKLAGTALVVLFIGVPTIELSEALEWVGIDLPDLWRAIIIVFLSTLLVANYVADPATKGDKVNH